MSRDRTSQVKRLTRPIRSTHSIELEFLLDLKIKVKRVNSIELKLNPTITLVLILFLVLNNLTYLCDIFLLNLFYFRFLIKSIINSSTTKLFNLCLSL